MALFSSVDVIVSSSVESMERPSWGRAPQTTAATVP